jgi:iron complex outermembrane receptor protein
MPNVANSDRARAYLRAGVATLTLSCLAHPAFAQQAPSPPEVATDASGSSSKDAPEKNSGDIVVTALRRNSRILDVPASVSALSASSLERRGAEDYRNILIGQPSVAYFDIGYQRSRVFIRGVSDGTGTLTDATTGTYIDEIPVTQISGTTLDIGTFDIDRVEILRGPQGTLYGAGAMGGTIRIITKKPSLDKFEGLIDGEVAGVYDGGANYRGSAMVNVPIVADRLALRIDYTHRRDGGFIDDPQAGKSDVNTATGDSVRAQMLFKLDERTHVLLAGIWQRDTYGALSSEDPGAPKYTQHRAYPESGYDHSKVASLTIDHDFGFATLLSSTNYVDKTSKFARDVTLIAGSDFVTLSGGPLKSGVGLVNTQPYKGFTEETRLTSNGNGPFKWVVGVFYQDLKPVTEQYFDYPADRSLNAPYYNLHEVFRRTQLAGFGELTYNLTPKLSATAGVRVFQIKGHNVSTEGGISAGGVTNNIDEKSSGTKAIQKYDVSWKFDPNHMLYGLASQGFRAGGPTNVPFAACKADLAAIGLNASPTAYGPDSLWNYEVGSKNSFFGKRVTLNVAAYQIDWSKIQAQRNLDCGFEFVGNVGKARIRGSELEMTAAITRQLEIDAGVSFTDSKVLEATQSVGARVGDQLPLVARWTANGSATYALWLDADSSAYLRVDGQYIGPRYNDYQGHGGLVQMPAYATLGLRFGGSKGPWEAAIYGTNVTSSHGIVDSYRHTFAYDLVIRPRTVGLEVKRHF